MPAPSITAVPDAARSRVRLDVNCGDFIGKGDAADCKLYRTVAGVTSPVRMPEVNGAGLLSGGRGTFYDTEAPLDTPVTYSALLRSPYGIVSPNASFEDGGVAGWSAVGATLAPSTVRAYKGAASALLTLPAPVAIATDTFTRAAVTGGWGTATTGGAWTAPANAARFSTDGTTGKISMNNWGPVYRILVGASTVDSDVYFSASTPVVAIDDGLQVFALARHLAADRFYALGMSFDPANGLRALIYSRQPNPAASYEEYTLGEWTVPGGYAVNTLYRCRAQVIGKILRLKVWPAAQAEPAAWTGSIEDTLISAAGGNGIVATTPFANNNTLPVVMTVDDYRSNQLPTVTVESPKAAIDGTLPLLTGRAMMWRSTTLDRAWRAGVRWYNAGQAPISVSVDLDLVSLTAGAWSEVAGQVKPPPGAVYAAAYFTLVGAPPDTDPQVWIDAGGVIPDAGGDPGRNTITATAAAPVSVASGGAFWLKDPLRPGNDVKVLMDFDYTDCAQPAGVVFVALDDEKYAAASAAFDVDRGERPIVLSAPRKDVESGLTLLAATFADRDRLKALLAAGSPLLFQGPAAYGIPDRYISVGDVGLARLAADHRKQWRVFGVPFVAVDAPAGPAEGVPGTRWIDLCNQYATNAALEAAGLTWRQIKQGAAG